MQGNKTYQKKIDNKYTTVILLDYIDKFAGEHEFAQPSYFKDELGIKDFYAFEKKMIREGYLKKAGKGSHRLTRKGTAFIEKNLDYIRFFNLATPYVNISEYDSAKKNIKQNFSFEETMIKLFLSKTQAFSEKDDYVAVKELHFETAKLYEELNMDPQAMYHYLCFLYFQTSGLEYYDDFINYISGKITKKELQSKYAGIYISMDIVNKIKQLGDSYVEDMADRIYERNTISINLCNKENFKNLVKEIMSGDYKSNLWQEKFREFFNGVIKLSDGLNKKIKAKVQDVR